MLHRSDPWGIDVSHPHHGGIPCRRRPRHHRPDRGQRQRRPGRRRPGFGLGDHRRSEPSCWPRRPGATFAAGAGSAGQTITVNPGNDVPVDDRLRRLVHRLVGLAGVQLAAAQRDHDQAVRPDRGIGLDFLRQPIGASDFARSLLQLRRHARRPDRPDAGPLLDLARPRVHPADPAAGAAAQPADHGHGDAVEPAGLDEDQRLDDRRLAERRRLPGLRRTTWSSSCRPTRPPACRSRC